MWFPEGTDWYDVSTGVMYKGGSEHTLLYTIAENPYFVKAGAVIPMAGPEIMTLQKQSPELRLFVVPGLGESSASVYEDDGQSQAYEAEYAVTKVTKKTVGNSLVLKVAPREGSFKGMLENRRVSVVLDGFCAPSAVKVNGKDVAYSRFASYEQEEGKLVWGYDGTQLQTTLWLEQMPASQEIEVEFSFVDLGAAMVVDGKKGLINRITDMTPEAKLRFSALKIRDFQIPSEFMNIAQCGSYITEDPANAQSYLQAMDVQAMIDNVNSWEKLSADFKSQVAAQTLFEK